MVRLRIVAGRREVRVLMVAGSGSAWTVVRCSGWFDVIDLIAVLDAAGVDVRVSVRDGVIV